MKTIVSVQVKFDTKGVYKYTKYSDGSIAGEPISSEEAALIQAERGF